jgi:hypothetical protein
MGYPFISVTDSSAAIVDSMERSHLPIGSAFRGIISFQRAMFSATIRT